MQQAFLKNPQGRKGLRDAGILVKALKSKGKYPRGAQEVGERAIQVEDERSQGSC